MDAAPVVLGVIVALAAAVRSAWSPCGQSMLSLLTPVREASRGYRYGTTACWFTVGALVGGAMLGAVMAALAAVADALDASSVAWLGIAATLAVVAALRRDARQRESGLVSPNERMRIRCRKP